MKKKEYEVVVSRTVTQTRVVTVEAGSKAEAESRALASAGDLDFHDGRTGDPEYGAEAYEKS